LNFLLEESLKAPFNVNPSFYIVTSEEMRTAIKKYGRVTLHIAKVLVTGGGGSGKTCTKAVLYGKVPPEKHVSTDLLKGEPTYCEKLYVSQEFGISEWIPARLTDIFVMLRNQIISNAQHSPVVDKAPADKDRADKDRVDKDRADKDRADKNRADKDHANKDRANKDLVDKDRVNKHRVDKDHVDKDHVDKECLDNDNGDAKDQSVPVLRQTGSSELEQKIKEQGLGSGNIAELYWVYFFDSAGQSEYLDIIPAFIENVTVTMYVLNLTKPLHHSLTDNFGIKGETGANKDEKFTVKGEQVLQAVLQTIQFQKVTKLMVVGTHRDKCEDEAVIKQRNKEVHAIIESTKCKMQNFDVLSNGEYNKQNIIFELSAIKKPKPDEDKHNKETAKDIRRRVSSECSQTEYIPTTWFLCEEDLKNEGKILEIKDCIPVAERNGVKEVDLKEMLTRFHELNIFFYYSEDNDLNGTVFTNPLIVMEIVSEVVKRARKPCLSSVKDPIDLTTQNTLPRHSLVNVIEGCLKNTSKDSKQLETLNFKLIKLLEKRLILVKFLNDDNVEYYYMPCIFPVCDNPHEIINKKCHPNQTAKQKLVHTSFLFEPEYGCAPRGIFYGLVCHFLRRRGAERELIHNLSDPGPYCNFIHGIYKQNPEFQVSLVNSFHYFEVHVIGPRYDNLKVICENIRKHLKNGLEEAYKKFYKEQKIHVPARFLCPATKDCCKNPHIANFPEDGEHRELVCSQNSSVTYKLDPEHFVWLNEEEQEHACGK
jgi:GTPase SAR1 family protein